ncbi:MAG TPA: ClbS/DfsB family four-helix bundle protein [Ktedonobacterales bacterium]|jgi:hypothetical protein
MSETEAMDKEGLLRRMNASYERIASTLDTLTPQQWLAPRELGAWSARDVVAHLTYWLDRVVAEVDAVAQRKAPRQPTAGLSDAEVDAANAQAAEAHRDETPPQTLGAFRRSYAQLVDLLQPLAWDDLAAVGRFEWLGQAPLWRVVAEDTWEHFDEHLPEIEWARSVGQG